MSESTVTYKREDGEEYKGNKTVTEVIIDDDVTEIAKEAFYDCTNLKTIVFSPNSKVKKIGRGAFADCTALEEVDLPNSLEELDIDFSGDDGVFQSCSNLKKVSFGSNLKIVGDRAFADTKVKAIVLKDKVTTIGEYAFHSCSNLSTVIWPESVTTVGIGVFEDCTELHELAGSDKQDVVIAYLKASPFAKLCITGKLEEAERIAEGNAEAVKQKDAGGRTPLNSFCQGGSSEETLKWLLEAYSDGTKVKDKDGNIPLHFLCNNPNVTADMLKCVIEAYSDGAKVKDKDGNIPLHILCKNPNVTADMLKWLLEAYSDGAKVKDKDGNIPLHFLYGNSARSDDMANRLLEAYPDAEKEKNKYGLTPLQMRDGIVVYKRGTLTKYMEDKTVTKVIVFSPNCKVKKIGYCAFYECTALEKVNLPDSLEELVGEEGIYGAFGRCRNLQKVSFGSNLKIVGYSTFCQCIKLEAIVLKDKVTTIGKRAFRQCDNLSTVIWPESVTTVGDAVFMESSKLHELAGSDEQDDVIAFLKSKSPLMQLCVDDGELEEMKNILKGAPDAAKQKSTQQGRTPLSYYCQFGTSVKALNWLLEAYPNATKEKDICNFTPLHYLCSNSASSLPALIKCFAAANPDPSQLRGSQAPKSKLVFEMLSHLTIDEMKACPDTEKGIRAAIDEKKTLQTNNSTAMSNIVDQEARAKTTELQRRMVAQLQDGKADAAQATFKELRDFSIKQADRLRDLIDVVMNKYRTTDPGRYKALEVIPKSTPGQQQLPAPASLSVEDQVKFQIAAASWEEKGFREKMSELVNFFNGSEMTCEQVCEHYGIENSDGRWSKEFRTTAYKLEKNTSDVVKARFGPPKGFPRALVKTKEGLEEEAKTGKKHNGLRDLNRITFEFEDPLLMVLLFEVLNTNFEAVGLKNNYLQETFKQPPDLHLNLDLGNGWLVEVQMLFRDILAIKKEDHKFYDVKRASSPWDVPDRLFKELADPVDALRAKLEELRHLEKVSKDVAVDGRVKELEAKIAAVESSADERMKRAEATTADERVKKAEAKIAEAAADERLKKVEAKISTVEAAADERVKKAEAKIAAMEAAADERMKKAEAKIAELEAENARLRVAAAQTPPPAPSPSPDLKILKRRSLRSGGGDKK